MNKRKILFIPSLPAGTFLGGVAGDSVPATAAAAGDWYIITSAGTSQSKTWAVGDRAYYNGSSGSWTQTSGSTLSPGYVAPTAISAAGNTNIALGTGEVTRAAKVSVSAGSAAFTHTLTLQSTNAVGGSEIQGQVSVAASTYPLIEIRNLTSGGTLLGTIVGDTVARVWSFTARFDGTNWFLTSFAQHRAASVEELAARANGKAPRGGLAFDGTSGARFYNTLTNQDIGADPAALVLTVRVPTAQVATLNGLCSLTSNGGHTIARGLYVYIGTSSDNLVIQLIGATTSDNRTATVTGFRSSYSGKVVVLAIVRSSGGLVVYVNGVAASYAESTAGTPPAWTDTITSTYWIIGNLSTVYPWTSDIHSASLYNLALSAADVLEISESGGAVPYRYQFGSQTELLLNGAFASDTQWTKDAGWTISAGAANAATAGDAQIYQSSFTLESLKAYRTRFTINSISAGTLRFALSRGTGTQVIGAARTTAGTYEEVLTMGEGLNGTTYVGVNAIGATTAQIDNASCVRVGAIVHFRCDDGIGYQIHDDSTNKLDAVMTTTGVAHLVPKREGWIRATSSTSGNQQLQGQALLTNSNAILRINARSRSGTPTVKLGTSSGDQDIVVSVALSTAWKSLTIALSNGGILTASGVSFWANSSSTDVVEWEINYEALTT
jgi:hypothetical protein